MGLQGQPQKGACCPQRGTQEEERGDSPAVSKGFGLEMPDLNLRSAIS